MDTTDFDEQREELLQRIERDQEGVRVAMHELTRAVGSRFDPRLYIRDFPLTWTIGGFLVGVWLGRRGAPSSVARQRRS